MGKKQGAFIPKSVILGFKFMRQNDASVRELIRYIALFSAVGGENVGGEEPIGNENLGDDDDFEE